VNTDEHILLQDEGKSSHSIRQAK